MADTVSRHELEHRFLHLTRISLPSCAKFEGWPVTDEDCFERILLDNAFGGVWTDHVAHQPGYDQIPDDVLASVVARGEHLLKDGNDIFAMNDASLRWRAEQVAAEEMGFTSETL